MENFKKLFPTEYYAKFIQNNVRPDGRSPHKFRKMTFNTGSIETADGSSFVKMGHTSVVAGAKAEVGKPTDSPYSQFELTPLCSARFRPGPPSEQAQVLSRQLNHLLSTTKLVSPEELTISAGKAVWYIYVDIYCLDYDGNIFDACLLALLTCLANVRLPVVEISEELAVEIVSKDRPIRLSLQQYPIPTTFGIILHEHVIADPTAEEEELLTATITVVANDKGQICALLKPGGTPASEEKVAECLRIAQSRVSEVVALIRAATST